MLPMDNGPAPRTTKASRRRRTSGAAPETDRDRRTDDSAGEALDDRADRGPSIRATPGSPRASGSNGPRATRKRRAAAPAEADVAPTVEPDAAPGVASTVTPDAGPDVAPTVEPDAAPDVAPARAASTVDTAQAESTARPHPEPPQSFPLAAEPEPELPAAQAERANVARAFGAWRPPGADPAPVDPIPVAPGQIGAWPNSTDAPKWPPVGAPPAESLPPPPRLRPFELTSRTPSNDAWAVRSRMAGVVSAREALETGPRLNGAPDAARAERADPSDQLVMWSDVPTLPFPLIVGLMLLSGILAGATAWLVVAFVL